ncbi:hypothetical protein BaRGS_00016761, partial [Batillaria attramentaria]
ASELLRRKSDASTSSTSLAPHGTFRMYRITTLVFRCGSEVVGLAFNDLVEVSRRIPTTLLKHRSRGQAPDPGSASRPQGLSAQDLAGAFNGRGKGMGVSGSGSDATATPVTTPQAVDNGNCAWSNHLPAQMQR